MKPNHLIADRIEAPAQAVQPPSRLERAWIKIDGKLECRWISAPQR